MSFKIDNIRMKISVIDLDGDGVTDEHESVPTHRSQGITHLKDVTELGEVMEHQNKDLENEQGMSSVDFISRLNSFSIAPISAVEFISAHGVISKHASRITRIYKRNVVSDEGKGRKEFVEVVGAKKDSDAKGSMANMVGTPKKEK